MSSQVSPLKPQAWEAAICLVMALPIYLVMGTVGGAVACVVFVAFAGKNQGNPILMTLLAPGLWLQRLTTRQPSLDQIEVSIRALQEVLRREGALDPAERKVEVMA